MTMTFSFDADFRQWLADAVSGFPARIHSDLIQLGLNWRQGNAGSGNTIKALEPLLERWGNAMLTQDERIARMSDRQLLEEIWRKLYDN